MTRRTTEEKIAYYHEHGWCPVDTSHLPEEIRRALSSCQVEPGMKACFENNQNFLLASHRHHHPVSLDLEYHEGIVTGIIPFEHAWLMYKGEILDITLEPCDDYSYNYLDSFTYTVDEVLENVIKTEAWCPLTDPRKFATIHPFHKELYGG